MEGFGRLIIFWRKSFYVILKINQKPFPLPTPIRQKPLTSPLSDYKSL
jgi:hypothetical protein